MLTLRVIHPGRGEQAHTFEACDVTLGRSPDCDITLDDPYLSSRHLRIQVGVVVSDLGSKNGVWVDGSRVEGPTVVTGKSLHLGSHRGDRPYVDVSLEGWAGDAGGTLQRVTEERDALARRCEELEGMRLGLLQELQGLRNDLQQARKGASGSVEGTQELPEEQTLMLGADWVPSSASTEGGDGVGELPSTAVEPVPADIPEDDDSRLDLDVDGEIPTLIGDAAFGGAGVLPTAPEIPAAGAPATEVPASGKEPGGTGHGSASVAPDSESPAGLPDFAAFFGGAGAPTPPRDPGPAAAPPPSGGSEASAPPSFTQFFGKPGPESEGAGALAGAPAPSTPESSPAVDPARPEGAGLGASPGVETPSAEGLSAEEMYMRALRGGGAPAAATPAPSSIPPSAEPNPGAGGSAETSGSLPGGSFAAAQPSARMGRAEVGSGAVGPHLIGALRGTVRREEVLDSGSVEELLALGALGLASHLETWIDGVVQGTGPVDPPAQGARPPVSATYDLLERLAASPGDPQRRKELVTGLDRLGSRARESALAYRQAGVELCREVRRDPGGPLCRAEGGTPWDEVRRKLDGFAADSLGGGTRAE